MKRLIFKLQYLLVRFISWFACLFRLSLLLKSAKVLGWFAYWAAKRPRKTSIENLKRAFPHKSDAERNEISKKAFAHLMEFGLEWLSMPKIIKRSNQYLIGVRYKEKIYEELKKKKGAIVLISHNGNWEIMALMGGLLVANPIHVPLYAVARPLANPYLYDYAMQLRGGMGLKTIDKSGGVRETFDHLRSENAIVCVLIDQRVSEGSVEVPFFGRPALTTSLPVVAALRLGTPIFHNFLYRSSDGKYEMKVEGPMIIERTGDFRKDIELNTRKFLSRVEEEIRMDPSRWLWMHNRWRPQHGAKD